MGRSPTRGPSITAPIYTGDPAEVNLVDADIEYIQLSAGWNFISFRVQPESTLIEEVFKSILTDPDNYLEYVADHADYWYAGVGGNLTDVDAYHSYNIKIDSSCTEGCTLAIKGLQVPPSHTFTLDGGWTNISYLLNSNSFAIKDNAYGYTGIFSSIKDDIVWIKGDNGTWCSPDIGGMLLEPGRGLYIKMKQSSNTTFKYEE